VTGVRRWIRLFFFGWGISRHRSTLGCAPSHRCEASKYWRAVAEGANDDADAYALQLRQHGLRPVHRPDGLSEVDA
jgi:hypothetical protein